MARLINRLTAKFVENAKESGRYVDGGGLNLLIKNGARRWVFRHRFGGQEREMSLGPVASVSLALARDLAARAREQVAQGIDPIAAREAERTAAEETARAAAKAAEVVPTFGDCADALIKSMSAGWRNAKHEAQWVMTLKVYAKPIRLKPVAEVDTTDVLAVLQPLWVAKPETASRLRGRIERVLDYARAQGLRSAENPARWRGHLDMILPRRAKLGRGHHAALPYPAIGAFMRRLRAREAVAARALEFLILTAARSGEVLGAKWDEIDLERKVWTVPGVRMKAGRDHRVPLSDAAVKVLEAVKPHRRGVYVFPTQSSRTKADAPLSIMAPTMLLRRLSAGDVTPHGFRSSFRDWAAEETHVANIVAEAALAHVVADKAEAAYRRGDLFERRRALMDDWAAYCAAAPKLGEVKGEEAA